MGFFNTVGNWITDFAYSYKPSNISQSEHDKAYQDAKARLNAPNSPSNNADKTFDNVYSNSLKSILSAYQTSALKAEKEATISARKWQEQQANLAWQRSQASAQKQMDFQKQQADLAWQRSESSAQKQMDFQREMAQQSMDYNERMSSTAYQRAVADLRKAGLNPILAVSNGSASSPSVSIPSGASASASAMSGASASASAPSGFKADYSSAKNSDLKVNLFDIFTGSLTSALKALLK